MGSVYEPSLICHMYQYSCELVQAIIIDDSSSVLSTPDRLEFDFRSEVKDRGWRHSEPLLSQWPPL